MILLSHWDLLILHKSIFSLKWRILQTSFSGPARLTNSKIVSTPLELNQKLSASTGTPLYDSSLYRQVVGSLVYSTITRPNIAYPVQVISQFVSITTSIDWAAILRIVLYLHEMMNQSLLSSDSSHQLTVYFDSDWAECVDTPYSTTGFCIFLDFFTRNNLLFPILLPKRNIVP